MGLEMITCDRPSSDWINISNCIGDTLCIRAGVGGIGIDGGEGWIISNCIVRNTQTGSMSGLPVAGITTECSIGDTANGLIVGCVITGCADGAMRFRTTSFATADLPGGTSVNITVSGCTMYSNFGKSIVADTGTTGSLLNNNYGGIDPSVPATWEGSHIAFHVFQDADQLNVTGDATYFVIPYSAEQFDHGSCVSAGVFTAPRAGIYSFEAGCQVQGTTATHTYLDFRITSSSGRVFIGHESVDGTAGRRGARVTALISLTAGQTVQASVRVGGGASGSVCDILGADSQYNYFTGHIVRKH